MRFGLRELIFMIVLLAVPVASWWYVFMPRNAEIVQAKIEVLTKDAEGELKARPFEDGGEDSDDGKDEDEDDDDEDEDGDEGGMLF